MNVFEFAMKMELDGKAYYEESAAKITTPELKRILLELAADEQKHYLIFRAMRDGLPVEFEESKKTRILAEVKNVFEKLKAQNKDFSFPKEAKNVWVHAREIEKKSEDFYREKAGEVKDAGQTRILTQIADEEQRHWITIENVIKFLDRPQHWLENAEWNNLEDY